MKRALNSLQEQLAEAVYGTGMYGRNPTNTESRYVADTVKGSHDLTIVGFSLAKGMGVGNFLASETFSVGGYDWAIYFYPDGKNPEDNSLYVSVFVALVSEGTDVRAKFELRLIDQSGKGRHKVHSHFERSLERGPYTLKYHGSMWGYKRFYRRAQLESSDFVKDDTLKICCTVGVVVSAIHGPALHYIHIPESNLGQQFGALLEDVENADVAFDVSGEKFHAHRVVLAARSPVFKSMFFGSTQDDWNDKEISIEDTRPEVFKAMLHFVYKDTLPDLEEHADLEELSDPSSCFLTPETMIEHLLTAADRYGLRQLRWLCESRISQGISVNSVAKILELAQRHQASQLKSACLKFAATNLEEVMKSEGFEYLKENCPSLQLELLQTVAQFKDD